MLKISIIENSERWIHLILIESHKTCIIIIISHPCKHFCEIAILRKKTTITWNTSITFKKLLTFSLWFMWLLFPSYNNFWLFINDSNTVGNFLIFNMNLAFLFKYLSLFRSLVIFLFIGFDSQTKQLAFLFLFFLFVHGVHDWIVTIFYHVLCSIGFENRSNGSPFFTIFCT